VISVAWEVTMLPARASAPALEPWACSVLAMATASVVG
jgi:hypothetical protein